MTLTFYPLKLPTICSTLLSLKESALFRGVNSFHINTYDACTKRAGRQNLFLKVRVRRTSQIRLRLLAQQNIVNISLI